ncbi:hypothetical protein D1BOALGB6SA_7101 [Olavius sp. associated proteobacterium Delta 1]|nr:hypothetical protein D1BOALGB6SA_7101 [Olavius sp. associated proteobacterium Delta 1]
MVKQWYLQNMAILRRVFGKVDFDEDSFRWVILHSFSLPPFYHQRKTVLLIETPGPHINNPKAFNFYADKGLSRSDMTVFEHIYEDSRYNHYSDYGLARLSLHLEIFQPSSDVISGDTLLDVTQNVYNFFALRKGL